MQLYIDTYIILNTSKTEYKILINSALVCWVDLERGS
jgi:hypothetical protein